ncbi:MULTISPECIES: SDR family oxidoreductase [Methylobacterium]|jgi:NADP-dependent 3-hydroxy acid dehydrogenase YdfG|uniref:Short-chain dehydrogenase/reductase SDR n=1 Tax=Methylobacterium radiotolerans (strain ATCC 27329 / DSM 1819 / JCM 2831 / NBRC 15690 / NCIMB 10815 / 0-1) TaxID=426355 RepID=B1M084_METRJ|nr:MULTISPECIES: SDR family oxidoreductase [Methylobacterium]MBE7246245.1 SDR family oxidoreductase [Actinomycetospora chiangmaiensis]GAN50959.1 short-chain dehydrogenase/reductase SDR [Methylobacterium sp. ME121]ACB25995.1 short-chain dehydrogenase/reductase SDR [Methylobacterium radiotolerans JCM 2831]KIU30580.1 oxidoreductase [Methylobacterium radiotolerans]KTS10834.1 oxidoreductase [Methylobacterium radiotolerans]
MMRALEGQVAWVTGAGSGIGQAAALALARAGMRLALTGRGREALARTAELVRAAGGEALVVPADMGVAGDVQRAWETVHAAWRRCDLLVNAAGLNVPQRGWSEITPAGIDAVVGVNLNGPFYAARAVLPTMRAQRGGLIIHVSSWAGRYVSKLTGPAYSAAKHGLVALSESLNQEECGHGIRSCCICPGEVATPLLDKRPVPVTAEDRGRMLQAEDLAETILFVARLPASVCVNEILISPTWNRGYLEGVKL